MLFEIKIKIMRAKKHDNSAVYFTIYELAMKALNYIYKIHPNLQALKLRNGVSRNFFMPKVTIVSTDFSAISFQPPIPVRLLPGAPSLRGQHFSPSSHSGGLPVPAAARWPPQGRQGGSLHPAGKGREPLVLQHLLQVVPSTKQL